MKHFIKRYLSLVLLLIFMSATVCGAAATSRILASGVKTADALIRTGWAEFHGITVSTDGANAVTVDIYNGTSAAGTKIAPTLTFPATPVTGSYSIYPPVSCSTGIYIDITTGGTASYVVYYYTGA